VAGVSWTGPSGPEEAGARVVVGADGLYSVLAKILEPAHETDFRVQRCMYYTYFHGIEPSMSRLPNIISWAIASPTSSLPMGD
jgi:flavin-dependent dehydrogenase